ncbi:insulin-like peptide INSL5 [Psammomys obesus]|uniref:insulin-like peptide INSL5 n=1 Tax=Psammomys obesus TaxID=48139 RepID=UPI0024534646|nr:insulin-like peptide INSL5 [Psammomys obesus]
MAQHGRRVLCSLALFLFSVLCAVLEVRSRETVKLCGLGYVRTVRDICAQLEGSLHAQQAETRNHLQLPDQQEASKETLEYNFPKKITSGQELVQDPQAPMEGLWQSRKHWVISRRYLKALCCAEGCSMAELRTLC